MKKSNKGLLIAGSTGLVVAGTQSANAALATGVTGAFTTLQTDALALVDLAWPVVVAVTVAFIILKLFKRAASAAV